ncbi:MAG: metalloregulator ArsR/SmtB family transcription factor [Thermomicrobiales bacterium]|nr:metalloregulator ArsR/SmtB family transcription factor [Thermomicrobiales bacterium]
MTRGIVRLMNAFDVLGDPVRREILQLLARGEQPAGKIVDVIGSRFGISQPAVSQHLKVLRDAGLVTVRADGVRRIYTVDPAPLREIDDWLMAFRSFWEPKLDALETEIARGKRQRRLEQNETRPEQRKSSA